MKNSILGKARWLRDVALATSKNNGARVAREWLKYAAMFVMLLTLGSGNAWGATSTLTLSSNNKFGTSSGSTKTSSDKIVTWKANTTNGAIQNTYSGSNAYNGQQFGTGTTAWTGTFTTSSISTKKITSVAIVANTGGSATLNVSVGGTTYTDKDQSVTKKANGVTPLTYTFSGTNTGSITITVSKTSKAFYLQSIAVTYEDAVPTTTVTASPASLDWGNVLQSSSQSTKTFDISGSNLTGNLSVVVTGGYSVSCGSSISVTSGTPNVTTITVTPPSTSTPGEKNGKVTISGGGLASNVEVNLTMTVQASHTVTWMVNGSEHATTQVADGSKPEFPNNPSSCDGTSTTFVGWTPTPWSGKLDDVSAKTIYTSGSAMPDVSGPVTYHAVFAKETSTLTPVQNTWTRITSTSQLTDGATVMLVHYSKYAINNTPGATSCTANAEITNSNAALRWIAVKSDSKWKFKTSAGKYLSTSATADNTTLSLNQTYDEWTISADAGGYSNCFNLNNGNDLEYFKSTFKLYKWSSRYSSAYPFYIYIQKTTGSTTYSQYLTTCCTSWSDPTFSYNTYSLTAGGAHATKTITGTTHGTLSFESSNTGVITVDAGTGEVTPVGAGTAYVIAHWTEADGYCAKDLNSSTFTVSGNVTVTFKKNGGTGTDNQTQSIPYKTATALKTLAEVGYTAPSCKEFKGWATSEADAAAGTIAYADGANITATGATTLWATWETINYTVTKGTSTGAATFSLTPASSVACNGTITVTATPDASHKGDPIVSISPVDAGTVSGTSITNVTKNITVNVEFAAKEVYTVTWSSPAGETTSDITEGEEIGAELPADPSSCSATYNTFVGWFPHEAGSEGDPTNPATWTGYADNDKVTASTVPTGSVTYYAVFSDGGGDEVTDVANIVSGASYYIYGRTGQLSFTDATGTQNGTAAETGILLTFTKEDDNWYITTPNGYYIYPSSSNGVVGVTKTKSDGALTITNQSSKLRISKGKRSIQQNTSLPNFGGYENTQTDVTLIGVASGYISTCGISVKVTNGTQHITSANGVWTASNAITVEGQRLTSSGSANKRIVVSSNNENFKIRAASTQDAGNASAVLPYSSPQTYITADSWSGTFEVTYTPTSANTTESATITVKVCNENSPTALAQKTFTVYGRSLPANFLIAVNDGTLDEGHWYAIPADMIAPYGSSCSSGLGTYKPIPITVDDNTNPTKATIAPARAVYQPAERSTPRTSPQTLRFKSKTLSGGTTYYLYGGGTGGEGETNNTHIQNASYNDSEKQKWFLETEDLQKYNVHLATGISPNVLGYTTSGGNNKVGQYSSRVATTKKDIWFLPFDASECTYFHAPTVTPVSLDETNYTVQFTVDRGATAWQISADGGSSWTDLGGVTLTGSCDPKTTAQVPLPLVPYRGKTVDLKVKSASVCSEQKTTFIVPNPEITVTTPWHLYGVTGQAFDNSEKTITLSGLYTGAGAETTVSSSNANIHAELVDPIENGEVAVRLTMTAGNATEGDHIARLTFNSTGAETRTVNLTITMQSLIPFNFDIHNVISGGNGGTLNLNTCGESVVFTVSPIYQGAPLELINTSGYAGDGGSAFSLYDVTADTDVSFTSWTSGTKSASGNPLTVAASNLTAGHQYKWTYTNNAQTDKNSTGVPYAGATYTFTAIDGVNPTALTPCPITTTGFTARWIDDNCAGNTTLDVYSQGASGTTYFNTGFATTNTESAYYSAADDKWIFSPSWDTYTSTQADIKNAITSDKVKIVNISNDASKRGFYLLSPKLSSWSATVNSTDIWKVTFTMSHQSAATQQVYLVFDVLDDGALTKKGTPSADAKTGVSINELAVTSATYYSDGNVSKTYSLTISGLDNTDRLRFKGVYTSSPSSLSSTKYNLFISNVKVENLGSKVPISGSPFTITSCATKSREITGLTANTTYFYKVTNSGNASNVMSVTTRSDDPAIDFSPVKAVLQTDVNGTTKTSISLEGTNLTLCELAASITGTNAALFGYDLSSATYNSITGELGGTLTITYHPTAEGTHTATLTIDGVTLELEGHSCPEGFGTMATAATGIEEHAATANWSQTTSGYLMLAENQKMNTELLINGGFEQDGLGWDGIPSAMMPTRGSRQTTICTSGAKTGSKCAIMTGYGSGSYLYPQGVYTGTSTLGAAIYGEKQTLPAGTYTISAYLHNASTSSELQNTNYGADCDVYLGVAVDCPSNMYATARRSLNNPTGQNINGKGASWFQVSETFTLNEPTSCYIYLAYKTSGPSYFAVDDISLKCTGIVPGNNFSEHPISSATSLALTDLKPSTSYSYYVVSSSGCESNIISFTTLASDDPITITATPNPISLIASKGSMSSQVVTIEQENAYAPILFSIGDACEGRISLSSTSVSATGGTVVVGFSPLDRDNMGDKGTCTITATTLGVASVETITVNWTVASGTDVNTPTVEVTNISNSGMTVEHNIEVGENSSVKIILDRELTEEEIEENVGDEIFFSKYYEAFMHKKLWAIYNPTNERISLQGTQVWRSKGSSAGEENAWNRSSALDLSSYGKEPGFIGPKEEIIIYASQNSYTCEQSKVDMTGWFGHANEGPLSYSGDDALLLVRKVRTGEGDYRTPPAESVEKDGEGNNIPLTWRTIVDDDATEWTLLDIIGARTKANMPDGSNLKSHWWWKNCSNGTIEEGDDDGWVGYGLDINEKDLSTNTCDGQTAGYLLSTNRCLLIRLMNVKSGNNAVAVNVGDMYTLGKGGIQSEWKGAHVPTIPNDKQNDISCENFSFVGGYDYSGYYNAWTPLSEGSYVVGDRNPDGSYTVSDLNVPKYWCNKLRIEIVENQTVNGVDVENVRHYQDYKVPIVVDENAATNTPKFFGDPNNPTYVGADENSQKGSWATACAECDVVIRGNVTLTHSDAAGSKTQFHDVQVYAGAKLNVTSGTLDLNSVQMRADNNDVSYAILNDDGSSITMDTVLHVKRIDDAHWYPFSLPYDCDVVTIRQLNGKTMGVYDDGETYGTWTIKYYDGEGRQQSDDFAGAGNSSKHWKPVPANGTLEKHKGYIIGLYETEWEGQHKSVYFPPKNPIATYGYTENGATTKTANVYSWATNNAGAKKMNKGWNFVGLPYISLYNPKNVNDHGINNTSVMITGSYEDDYADQDHVYVSLPTDANMKYFSQSLAGNTILEPFKAYFVQVDGETDQTRTITYYKSDRTLNAAPRRARAAANNTRVGFEVLFGSGEKIDNTGILLSDDYSIEYEIGRDLYKMTTSGDKKPHIWSLTPANEKMAYCALPMANAQNVPLGLYAPQAGTYTISKDSHSDVSNVEAIYLLHNGEIVADLLFTSYELQADGAGNISGYAIRVIGRQGIATDLNHIDMNNEKPQKFIYHDKLYIWRNGMIYDATGKKVK